MPVSADVASEADVKYELVDTGFVLDEMANAGTRLNVVVLDACRNNPFGRRGLRAIGSGLAQIQAPAGTVIGYATQPGNTAHDGDGSNSPYTEALAAAIRRPGLTVVDVFNEVGLKVKQATGGEQQPWLALSPIEGRFFFSGEPPPPPSAPAGGGADATELAFWNSVSGGRIAADFEDYLERYPRGQFAGIARRRLADLKPPPASPPPPQTTARNPGDVFRDCPDCPEMAVIPAGRFMMGSPASEEERDKDEGPQHPVTIAHPFAVGKYAVTFAEWDACVAGGGCNGYLPEDQGWGRDRRPVIGVSWDDAQAYIQWVNRKVRPLLTVSAGSDGPYRLLSEAEWEYAARAGTTTARSWGDGIGRNNASCDGCGSQWDNQRTAPVGSFAPNRFGLHDMLGNVWQWTADCYHDSYNGAPSDGRAWTTGDFNHRVLRGGSWVFNPNYVRSASRGGSGHDDRHDYIGFRVARTTTP